MHTDLSDHVNVFPWHNCPRKKRRRSCLWAATLMTLVHLGRPWSGNSQTLNDDAPPKTFQNPLQTPPRPPTQTPPRPYPADPGNSGVSRKGLDLVDQPVDPQEAQRSAHPHRRQQAVLSCWSPVGLLLVSCWFCWSPFGLHLVSFWSRFGLLLVSFWLPTPREPSE